MTWANETLLLFIFTIVLVIVLCRSYYLTGYYKGIFDGTVDLIVTLADSKVLFIDEDGSIYRMTDTGTAGDLIHKAITKAK